MGGILAVNYGGLFGQWAQFDGQKYPKTTTLSEGCGEQWLLSLPCNVSAGKNARLPETTSPAGPMPPCIQTIFPLDMW